MEQIIEALGALIAQKGTPQIVLSGNDAIADAVWKRWPTQTVRINPRKYQSPTAYAVYDGITIPLHQAPETKEAPAQEPEEPKAEAPRQRKTGK